MNAAFVTISIIIVIASILVTLVVLVQNSKGGGLAANFASGNQTFGVRQTTDFLEKLTWGLATTIIVLCILSSFVLTRGDEKSGLPKGDYDTTAPAPAVDPRTAIPVATGEAAPAAEASAAEAPATEATPAN